MTLPQYTKTIITSRSKHAYLINFYNYIIIISLTATLIFAVPAKDSLQEALLPVQRPFLCLSHQEVPSFHLFFHSRVLSKHFWLSSCLLKKDTGYVWHWWYR